MISAVTLRMAMNFQLFECLTVMYLCRVVWCGTEGGEAAAAAAALAKLGRGSG
jgi:hypothetical protein